MSGVETRHISRDSLFLMAEVRLDGQDQREQVKVRNLSRGGMMAEGAVKVVNGARLAVNLRNIGWIEGNVAWVQDNRFGIAFATEIDPKLPREPVGGGDLASPRFTRPASYSITGKQDASRLRKI